jgi:predicted dehydrogenase
VFLVSEAFGGGMDAKEAVARSQDQQTSTVRIAVVGYGLIGRKRAEAVCAIPGARLAAIVDPRLDASPPLDEVRQYSDLSALPSVDYDAAIIAVPHDLAGELARAVLDTGKPVLIEKPLGITGHDARVLEDQAASVERPSFVGYNYRFLPAIRGLNKAIADGQLGELRNIELLVGHGGHPGSAEGWKLDPARAGGGVLLDPGVHLLDLLLRIAPEIECTDVQATRGFWPTGIEEDVVATFRSGNLLATVHVSHIRWVNTFRVEVFGDDGYAIAEGRGGNYGPMSLRVGRRWAWTQANDLTQRGAEIYEDFGDRDESLQDELESVVRAWQSGSVPADITRPATFSEARAVTELCDLLYSRIA